MRLVTVLVCLVAGPALAAPPDNVSPLKSHFTTVELATCNMMQRQSDGNAWLCDGLPGFPVYIAEGDQRFFMSFGPKGEQHKAATQSLTSFNTLFKDKRDRVTIEWRYIRRDGQDRPYAAIVRYFTSKSAAKGQVLVVTRIAEREACHLAYIDALANSNAIAVARSVADDKARNVTCSGNPAVVGATGRSPM